eukprot:TRINITY_DN634_c0_g1_i4.p2 TRINITY_DN634_c0_g1~~TRINITY_DN634_c0_g1_i4.p2  ORF type:complete len:212 (+),score=42.63 TRINITY_DN634_c0_g1_i4:62-697(+)
MRAGPLSLRLTDVRNGGAMISTDDQGTGGSDLCTFPHMRNSGTFQSRCKSKKRRKKGASQKKPEPMSTAVPLAETLRLPVLVLFASWVQYVWMGMRAGKSRKVHKIAPPAMNGPPDFECRMRVFANQAEQAPHFIASVLLSAIMADPRLAAAIGAAWIVIRTMYALAYTPENCKGGKFMAKVVRWTVPAYLCINVNYIIAMGFAVKGLAGW